MAGNRKPKATADGYDPYASQRHKRGRKSHLAAAINQNVHDHPSMQWVWFVVIIALIVMAFALAVLK